MDLTGLGCGIEASGMSIEFREESGGLHVLVECVESEIVEELEDMFRSGWLALMKAFRKLVSGVERALILFAVELIQGEESVFSSASSWIYIMFLT